MIGLWAYQVEHEECGCDGEDGALVEGGQAIGDGGHGVLPNAPVDVAAGVVAVDAAARAGIGLASKVSDLG